MKKKCKIVLIPTDRKTILMINTRDENRLESTPNYHDSAVFNRLSKIPQHLFILSPDEEIKEGDYWIYLNPKEWNIQQEGIVRNNLPPEWFNRLWDKSNYKKVIASTDLSLSNLPPIPTTYLQEYIKDYNNGVIPTEVEVEYEECEWKAKMPIDFLNHIDITQGLPIIAGTKEATKWNLKLSPNGIVINKIKDSWTREEVEDLIRRALIYSDPIWGGELHTELFNDWIQINL